MVLEMGEQNDGSDFIAGPDRSVVASEVKTEEPQVVAGKSAIYEDPSLGSQLVDVYSIDPDRKSAIIYPDITDKTRLSIVPLEALRPVPKTEIPEELK